MCSAFCGPWEYIRPYVECYLFLLLLLVCLWDHVICCRRPVFTFGEVPITVTLKQESAMKCVTSQRWCALFVCTVLCSGHRQGTSLLTWKNFNLEWQRTRFCSNTPSVSPLSTLDSFESSLLNDKTSHKIAMCGAACFAMKANRKELCSPVSWIDVGVGRNSPEDSSKVSKTYPCIQSGTLNPHRLFVTKPTLRQWNFHTLTAKGPFDGLGVGRG